MSLAFLRKSILLYVLLLVGVGSWLSTQRATSWTSPLWVTVHPINGDGSAASARYIDTLKHDSFADIERFFVQTGKDYDLAVSKPIKMTLGARVEDQPPQPPHSNNIFAIIVWSLHLRWWNAFVDKGDAPAPSDIDIYVRYFDANLNATVDHSLGLKEGRIGIVNAFAGEAQSASNNVIVAHEMLHTLGATDKYDPATNLPLYPNGYAEPDAKPRYPQRKAELMGGRVPLSTTKATIPRSLSKVVIGPETALEIRWR